jgi:hypothetical protein
MSPLIWLIPSILLVILIGITIWIYRKKKKIKAVKASAEYDEVLNDFNMAEQMYANSLKGGSNYGQGTNPYTILWEIAKSKRRDYAEADTGTGIRAELPELPELPKRPEVVPGHSVETDANYESESSGHQGGDSQSVRRRKLFGRRH